MPQTIFKRYENKYILNESEYRALLKAIEKYTVPDRYGKSTVCSIYYDTPDRRLIRASIEKPIYKEKLRLRSYGIPGEDSDCFLELKKKYKGVVYKRRIAAPYSDGLAYMEGNSGIIPPSQIKNEIEYFKKYYGALSPSVDIFYSRLAFYDAADPNVRLTFDSNILYRDYEPDLKNGIYGERVLQNGLYLMELKTAGAMPLWTAEILTRLKIYPSSFSKYGTAYKNILNKKLQIGGDSCA
ncbi:MAG: polyphosphate polymerase domain-containing protein [Acutalibacteraceae bacterium]